MASKQETIEKMQMAQELSSKGKSVADIAKTMKLSESRVRELVRGVNWYSRDRKTKAIR